MNLSCVSGITEPGVFPDPECGRKHAAVIQTMDKALYEDDHGTGQRTDGLTELLTFAEAETRNADSKSTGRFQSADRCCTEE